MCLSKLRGTVVESRFIIKGEQRANSRFFVRSVYAPIQYSLFSDSLFSMVAHNGKGFALCRFPLIAVFDPVMCYRQIVESFAVTSQNYQRTPQK